MCVTYHNDARNEVIFSSLENEKHKKSCETAYLDETKVTRRTIHVSKQDAYLL